MNDLERRLLLLKSSGESEVVGSVTFDEEDRVGELREMEVWKEEEREGRVSEEEVLKETRREETNE